MQKYNLCIPEYSISNILAYNTEDYLQKPRKKSFLMLHQLFPTVCPLS
jgi:hypothetical protein